MARADVAGDVQLLAAVARALVLGLLARCRRGMGRMGRVRGMRVPRRMTFASLAWRVRLARVSCRLGSAPGALALGLFGRALLGHAARVFLRLLAGLLLLDAAAVLGLDALGLAPLGFRLLALCALGLLGFAPLCIELLLLRPRLPLEHVALDVGALAAHLDVDGARAALIAGELELALRLALERDAVRRRAGLARLPWLRRRCVSSSSLASSLMRSSGPDT